MKFMVVWEVFCLKSEMKLKGIIPTHIIVDDDGDPRYECPYCGTDSSHLPPTKSAIREMPNERARIDRWKHYKVLLGRVYENDLRELAAKDNRAWRDDV